MDEDADAVDVSMLRMGVGGGGGLTVGGRGGATVGRPDGNRIKIFRFCI